MAREQGVNKIVRSKLFFDIAVLAGIVAVAYFVYAFFGGNIMLPKAASTDSTRQYSAEEIAQIQASLASSTAVDSTAKPYTAEEIAQIQASLAASKSVQADTQASRRDSQ